MCALCRKTVRSTKAPVRRKKIWEIESPYHCSIIGTCLSVADLKKIAGKHKVTISSPMTPYMIHSHFVHQAAEHDDISKKMNKLLDQKFRRSIKKFSTAKSGDDLKKIWIESRKSRSLSGTYWAAMTHPAASDDLMKEFYGEVHMLSHRSARNNNSLLKRLSDAEERVEVFKQALMELRTEDQKLLSKQSIEIEILREQLTEASSYGQQLIAAKERIYDLKNGPESIKLCHSIQELTTANTTFAKELKTLKEEKAYLKKERDQLKEENLKLNGIRQEQHDELKTKEDECRALDNLLQDMFTTPENECIECKDFKTDKCPGPDLCGRKILYVGGRHALRAQYRWMIEKCGGKFIHHDGGKEDSRQKLPNMVGQADVVIFPVDCVSHDASLKAKKICKQQEKPFIAMRTASVTSLAKSLGDISSIKFNLGHA